jgi:DNA-binding beta-propeller fold protein YncE
MEANMERNNPALLVKAVAVLFTALGLVLSAAPASKAQTGKAYVSAQDGTKIFVFDLSKNSLSKTINVFSPTPLGKALPPNINDILMAGGKVFATIPGPEIGASGINEVRVFDPQSDTLLGTIKTDVTPSGLLEYEGSVYVVNRYGHTIQVIDSQTLKIVRTIPFANPKSTPMNNPLFMEIVNNKIYLAFPGALSRPGGVLVMNLKTGESIKFIDFSAISDYGPVAIKRIGNNKIYLGASDSIAVLDTETDEIIKIVPLLSKNVYVQSFAAYKNRAYAVNGVSTVDVIDTGNDTVLKEIDIGYHSYAFHLSADVTAANDRVFVSDAGRGLKIIDARTEKLIATIPMNEPLGPVAIVSEGSDSLKQGRGQ